MSTNRKPNQRVDESSQSARNRSSGVFHEDVREQVPGGRKAGRVGIRSQRSILREGRDGKDIPRPVICIGGARCDEMVQGS